MLFGGLQLALLVKFSDELRVDRNRLAFMLWGSGLASAAIAWWRLSRQPEFRLRPWGPRLRLAVAAALVLSFTLVFVPLRAELAVAYKRAFDDDTALNSVQEPFDFDR